MRSPLIAIVNDEPALVITLTDLLTAQGCRVIPSPAGPDTVMLIRTQQSDLVVLDQSTEHPDPAWRVLELLQLDAATREIPVILCTTDRQVLEHKQAQLHDHLITILEKPFYMEELVVKIGAILAGQFPDDAGGEPDSRAVGDG